MLLALSGCATVDISDGVECKPAPDDVVVRLVETLSQPSVDRVSPVPSELALQFSCDETHPGRRGCVLGIDEGDEDFRSTRLAMYDRASRTLIIAEGQDEEYIVTRVGFTNQCVSLPTAKPLHMSSEVDAATLDRIFDDPDVLYDRPNLLAGDGFIATLARDSGVYLEFARDWAATLLDDLSELIRLK